MAASRLIPVHAPEDRRRRNPGAALSRPGLPPKADLTRAAWWRGQAPT